MNALRVVFQAVASFRRRADDALAERIAVIVARLDEVVWVHDVRLTLRRGRVDVQLQVGHDPDFDTAVVRRRVVEAVKSSDASVDRVMAEVRPDSGDLSILGSADDR